LKATVCVYAPKARVHLEAWGNAPGFAKSRISGSAESAIHFLGKFDA